MRQADIVEDQPELVLRHDLPDGVLHLREGLLRLLDPHPGAGADVQGHLARLDLREVILPDEGEETRRHGEDAGHPGQGAAGMPDHRAKQPDIAGMKAGEAALERIAEGQWQAQQEGAPPRHMRRPPVMLGVFRRDEDVDEDRHQVCATADTRRASRTRPPRPGARTGSGGRRRGRTPPRRPSRLPASRSAPALRCPPPPPAPSGGRGGPPRTSGRYSRWRP